MFFNSNIKLLRKRKGRTQDDVACILGKKRSTLSGYENKIAQPNIDVLIAFSRYFNISIDTLVKVDLRLLSQSQLLQLERGDDVYIKGSKLRVLATTVDRDNKDNIELVHEKAKSGYTRGFADPEYISELPVFQLPFLPGERKYRTFQISGDSMLPIQNGSWVTGEFLQDWHMIRDGKAYIILTMDEGVVFKLVFNKIKTDNVLILSSLNPIYEPYSIAVNEIKEIWRFVNYISSEIPDPNVQENNLIKTVASLKHDINKIKIQVLKK